MPRKPIEWSKCIIYKIWKDDDFYVGSTTDFSNRKRSHKKSCNNKGKCYNLKLYQTIREKGGWIAWQMTPLEEYKECQSKMQSIIREEEWRVKIQANLNMRKAFGAETRQEYLAQHYQEHKEKNAEYHKIYRETNKEQFKEKYTCECSSILRLRDKARHEKTQKHISFIFQK